MELFSDDMFGGGSPFGGMGGFFGGMGGGRRRGPPRGEDTIHKLKVSLDDLNVGKVSKLQLSKSTICTDCSGVGGYGTPNRCGECRGRGITVSINQIGPGMVQQMQGKCQSCDGEGEIMDPSERCKTCEGRKVMPDSKFLEVKVEPGMRDNQKIVFRGEGNQMPGVEPGNVIILIQEKEHEHFKREGADLFLEQTISLSEALCGFTIVVEHLNGRKLVIGQEPGEVFKPDTVKTVNGEGMPVYQAARKGDLYINFKVDFPPKYFAPEDKLKLLERLLGGRAVEPPLPEGHEEVNMEDLHEIPDSSGGRGCDDDEDMRHGAPPGVQCAQQ